MANEKRLIDANALMDAFRNYMVERYDEEKCVSEENCKTCEKSCLWRKKVSAAPTVDAVEVVHGRWVLGNVEPGYFTPGGNRPWVCSKCGEVISYRLDKPMENYCPNCGAKMDGGNEDV